MRFFTINTSQELSFGYFLKGAILRFLWLNKHEYEEFSRDAADSIAAKTSTKNPALLYDSTLKAR